MKPKKNQELTLKIDALVYGGSGIGQVEGFKVFVEGVAPGDTVEARVTRVKNSYGEAKPLKILEASPLRIEPRCKHFGVCGGCKWQFLDYADQCKVKEQQVKDAVERIGGLSPELVKSIIPNESPWFYRNKMELSFGSSPDGKAMLGFYPPGYHYEVFDLEECFLQSTLLPEIVKKVRDFANKHAIPVYNSHTHEGLLRSLTIREGETSVVRTREVLNAYIAKTKETANARMVGGVCVSGDNPKKRGKTCLWNMENYFELVLEDPTTHRCMGVVLLHAFDEDGKTLTASFNPSSTYLYKVDEAALFKGLLETLKDFAQENGFSRICSSKNKAIRTNRTGGMFEKAMDDEVSKVAKTYRFSEEKIFSYSPDYKILDMDVLWEAHNAQGNATQ